MFIRSSEVKSLSRVWLFATPWTITYQAPLSMGFSRQEYWSGVPLPSPVIRRGEKLLLNKLLLNIQNQLITLTFTVRNQMQWKRIIPSLYYGCVSLTFIQSMNVEKSIFYSKAYRTFKVVFRTPKYDFWLGVTRKAYICKCVLKLKKNINLHSYTCGKWYCC